MASIDLGTRRVRLVLADLAAARPHGWQTQLAKETGIHRPTWSKIAKEERGAGRDVIIGLSNTLGIDPLFFTDPTLGDSPDYRAYIGTRVERDDARGTPNAEAYIAGQSAIGRPVSEEHARRLRSIRLSSGDMPIASFEMAHRGWMAEEDGKVLERRGAPVEAKIDEARGQRKLEPLKKPLSRLGRR